MSCIQHSLVYVIHIILVFISEKVRKRANIRNRYNQAPQLTQDTNGKLTMSQLDISWVILHALLSSADFFQNNFFEKFF